MIFVVAANEPTMILMLSEQDVTTLRAGYTKFVDDRQTEGRPFTKVVLSLHKTEAEAISLVRQFGVKDDLPYPGPKPGESRCSGCEGLMPSEEVYEDKCVICWANLAKDLQLRRN